MSEWGVESGILPYIWLDTQVVGWRQRLSVRQESGVSGPLTHKLWVLWVVGVKIK